MIQAIFHALQWSRDCKSLHLDALRKHMLAGSARLHRCADGADAPHLLEMPRVTQTRGLQHQMPEERIGRLSNAFCLIRSMRRCSEIAVPLCWFLRQLSALALHLDVLLDTHIQTCSANPRAVRTTDVFSEQVGWALDPKNFLEND